MFAERIGNRPRTKRQQNNQVTARPPKRPLLVKQTLNSSKNLTSDPYNFRQGQLQGLQASGTQSIDNITHQQPSNQYIRAELNSSDGILVQDREEHLRTPRVQPNRSWLGGISNDQGSQKILTGVQTDNYFSLITSIRQEAQRLIDQFGLPPADIHRMVTYKQLFEWLIDTLRGLLKSSGNQSRSASPTLPQMLTERRRLSPEKQLLRKECHLLKETNRLLLQSEATAKMKLQQVKNEWRIACQKMKTLHGMTDDRSSVPVSPGLNRSLVRNLSFVQPNQTLTSEPCELKTSRSQKLPSFDTSGEQPPKISYLAVLVDQLTVQLDSRNKHITQLEQEISIKDKQIQCLTKELNMLMEKVQLAEGFKTERAVLYEQQLLQQIRRVSGEPKSFGRKQVRRLNTTEVDNVRLLVGIPQPTRRPDGVDLRYSPSPTDRSQPEQVLIPRLTFNCRQQQQPSRTEHRPSTPKEQLETLASLPQ